VGWSRGSLSTLWAGHAPGLGGSPLQTTLSRSPLGHSGPPRDCGLRLRLHPEDRGLERRPPQPHRSRAWPTSDQLHQMPLMTSLHEITCMRQDASTRRGWSSAASLQAAADHSVEGWVGRGALSRGPYLLGRFFEAPNQHLVAGPSGQADCDSAWSRESAPLPAHPVDNLKARGAQEFREREPDGKA